MKTKGIALFAKNANRMISKNSPTILTAMGVGGLIGTVIMAVKATPKAITILDDEMYHRYELEGSDQEFSEWLGYNERDKVLKIKTFDKLEVTKLCWKEYVPTVIMGSLSIACIVGANSVNLKKNAALAGLYSVATNNLKEYQDKVVEVMGDKKHKKIQDEVAKQKIKDNPVAKNEILFTGKGEVLCLDAYTGRYFKHDIEAIRRAENMINKQLLTESSVTLNDFYYEIGLPNVRLGDEVGWNIDSIDAGMINIRLSAQLTPDDVPCMVVDFDTVDYL